MDWTLKQACFQGYPESAVYVQVPIGSRNSAIHNAYHSSLRPSSLFEPRHRSLKVVKKDVEVGNHRPNECLCKEKGCRKGSGDRNRKEVTSTHPALPPLSFHTGVLMQSPSLSRSSHPEFTVVISLDACE